MNKTTQWTTDVISPDQAQTLHGAFLERLQRSPSKIAYRYFDKEEDTWIDLSWQKVNEQIHHYQVALQRLKLEKNSRVGIMLYNCPEWVFFEQAALRSDLIVVPLYPNDRPDCLAHILNDSDIRLLIFLDEAQWQVLAKAKVHLQQAPTLVCLNHFRTTEYPATPIDEWLQAATDIEAEKNYPNDPHALATIVYTSGTTGRPKGVMLSHHNILWNAHVGQQIITVYQEDLFLSFLPLSHTFERTIGYYLPMLAGSCVAYTRSITHLAEDLLIIKPTILISVPRIFERVHGKIQSQLAAKSAFAKSLFQFTVQVGLRRFAYQQGRAEYHWSILLWPLLDRLVAKKIRQKLGNRLRFAISGGAPLQAKIAEIFLSLGVKIQQGYGMTEVSPVVSVNPLEDNIPASIGVPLPSVEIKLDEHQQLLTRSPCVMLGYWNNMAATQEIMTDDGWLCTGDLAKIADGHIFITGRRKEIIVLSNGEKVPPIDMEMAIALDPLFEHAIIIGETRPYLSAIISLDAAVWQSYLQAKSLDANNKNNLTSPVILQGLIEKISERLADFPGYAQVRKILLTDEAWTVENEILTTTLKVRRNRVMEKYKDEIESLYTS